MTAWADTPHCQLRVHCRACLSDRAFRDSIASVFVPPPALDCPNGVTLASLPVVQPVPSAPRRVGLGDWIAWALAWMGVRKRSGCGCGQRQAKVNRWGWRVLDGLQSSLDRLRRRR